MMFPDGKNREKIEIYAEEIRELYHECDKSDGFDLNRFVNKLSGHKQAARVDNIDADTFETLLKDIVKEHWDLICEDLKKVA